jgi:hypothetical protein
LQRKGKLSPALTNPVDSLTNTWLYDDGSVNEQLRDIFMPVIPQMKQNLMQKDEDYNQQMMSRRTTTETVPVEKNNLYKNHDVSPFNAGIQNSTQNPNPISEDRHIIEAVQGMASFFNGGDVDVSQCLDAIFPDINLEETIAPPPDDVIASATPKV